MVAYPVAVQTAELDRLAVGIVRRTKSDAENEVLHHVTVQVDVEVIVTVRVEAHRRVAACG